MKKSLNIRSTIRMLLKIRWAEFILLIIYLLFIIYYLVIFHYSLIYFFFYFITVTVEKSLH